MVDLARATPWESDTKWKLKEQNARGRVAQPLTMLGSGSQPSGCRGCPALYALLKQSKVEGLCMGLLGWALQGAPQELLWLEFLTARIQ